MVVGDIKIKRCVMRKLSREDHEKIANDYFNKKYSVKELAMLFQVRQGAISDILAKFLKKNGLIKSRYKL